MTLYQWFQGIVFIQEERRQILTGVRQLRWWIRYYRFSGRKFRVFWAQALRPYVIYSVGWQIPIAVGTLLSGSWYVRVNQPDFLDSPTWSLTEAQYLRQTDGADYVIGSQPTFWRSQGRGIIGV